MDIGRRIEGARNYDSSRVSREVIEQELSDNAGLLDAVEARIRYLVAMIENPDPVLVQEDPNFITDLKARLSEAVQEKQRLTAEKERIERELSTK